MTTPSFSDHFKTLNRLHHETSEDNPTRRERSLAFISSRVWRELESHAAGSDRLPSKWVHFDKYHFSLEDLQHFEQLVLFPSDYDYACLCLRHDAPEITWTVINLHTRKICSCVGAPQCHSFVITASWTWDDRAVLEEHDLT
jgi:hypothetical protein